ncbi:MAG: nucleotide sugar dehydrogenase, partial [Actinobacteria bacterium]|nr:nucleotide sugar dehydrogenase [Actinomycetota bacterium]
MPQNSSSTARPVLSVIGTGYLGATHAACMAELGFTVIGVDVDPDKVASLSAGVVPFFEPDLDDLLKRNIDAGRLRFTTSFAEAGEAADVHFICVGTPQQPGAYAADMSQVFGSISALAPHVSSTDVIVGKSTVPVGTADEIVNQLKNTAASGVDVVWNPEFLREGFAVQDTLQPDRLVVGVASERAEQVMRSVYAPLIADGVPFLVTDFPTAELVKVAANSFLATKISFINAMAEVCETAGADVTMLATAIGYDPRIGNRFLSAGLGFGGGCLPKDIRAFMARAGELGAEEALTFLREVDQINLRRRAHTVDLARKTLGGDLRGKVVNAAKASQKQVLDNAEAQALFTSVGAGAGRDFTLDDARYGRIVILCDADVDGRKTPVTPVGLGDDAHTKALAFQSPTDDGHAKTRVI